MTALPHSLSEPYILTRYFDIGVRTRLAVFTVFDSRGRCLGTTDIRERAERLLEQLKAKSQNPRFSAVRRHKA